MHGLPFCRLIAATIILMGLFSCAGTRPGNLGVSDGKLAACPARPNCISSDGGAAHAVPPFELARPAAEAWREARAAVEGLPRANVVAATEDYLHAECRSAVFGFVDDLELHLRPAENRIAVRSAARLGYSDLGVNRRRVERLRQALRDRGVAR